MYTKITENRAYDTHFYVHLYPHAHADTTGLHIHEHYTYTTKEGGGMDTKYVDAVIYFPSWFQQGASDQKIVTIFLSPNINAS